MCSLVVPAEGEGAPAPESQRELLARLLAEQQQNIDLRARLDREHLAHGSFLRFSERANAVDDLAAFWDLALEETITTFSAEYALLVRREGDGYVLCSSCCVDEASAEELATLGRLAAWCAEFHLTCCDGPELATLGGRAIGRLLVSTFRDRDGGGSAYALVGAVSLAKLPFYSTFDCTLGPLFAAFANHVAALQQHIRAREDSRRVAAQLQRLAEVANRTSNAVVVTDREGRIEWVNDGFVRLTGWSLHEVAGCRPESFLAGPATDIEMQREMVDAVRARLPFEVEIAHYSKSGRQYWVHIESRVIYDERGDASGFVVLETDITERRLLARRDGLAQRIAGMLLASDSLEVASRHIVEELVTELDELGVRTAQFWVVDPRATTLRHLAGAVSPACGAHGDVFLEACRTYKYSRGLEPITGVGPPGYAWGTLRVCFVPDLSVLQPTPRRLETASAAGIESVCAVPVTGPDGVLAVLEVGCARGHAGFELLPAILERTAEQAAAFILHDQSRMAFRSIFEQSPDGMLLVDANGHVRAANARAHALFGAADHYDLSSLLFEGDTLLQRALETAPREGSIAPVELLHRDARGPNGRTFSAEVSVAATPSSPTQAAIIAVRDLTDRHRMEAALTQSLREKETLLKEIHHRVKNNLQIISSLLLLQVDQTPSPEASALLRESVHRVRSMALVHQQLYGAASLERVSLDAYSRQLADTLRSALGPSARVLLDCDPVEVTVDHAVPYGLILNELLTNALKYGVRSGSRSEVDVVVTLRRGDDDYTLRVRDHGDGLPPGFDPTTSNTLGLQLVRTLTRQVRGRFTFENNGGACLQVVVPQVLR